MWLVTRAPFVPIGPLLTWTTSVWPSFSTSRIGVLRETFAHGLKDPEGAALHPQTGMLWTHEHGPQGGDEINVIRAGLNYGWPVITYGVNYGIGTKIGEGTRKEGLTAGATASATPSSKETAKS